MNCCFVIKDRNGIEVGGTTTNDENFQFSKILKGEKVEIYFSFKNIYKHDMTFSVDLSINNISEYGEQEVMEAVDLAGTFISAYDSKRPIWYVSYNNVDIDYINL